MTWVKLDDGFFDNGTNRRLGAIARDLFIASLCFCAKGLTDGKIPKEDLPLLLAQAQAPRTAVTKLTNAGRWTDEGKHFEVVDYLSYNPSREQVLAERTAAAERQRKYRESRRRNGSGDDDDHAGGDAVTHGHPVPSPVEDNSTGSGKRAGQSVRGPVDNGEKTVRAQQVNMARNQEKRNDAPESDPVVNITGVAEAKGKLRRS